MKAKVGEELKQHFRPEFLNRVDDIIVFHQLERDEIFEIVDLMIAKVDDRLKDRDMGIELRPAAKELLSERGYDPVLGARPLRRTIQREIEDMLSEKILFGELRPGTIVIVDTEGTGEEAKFTFTSGPKPESVPEAAALGAAAASEPSSGTNPGVAPSSEGPGTARRSARVGQRKRAGNDVPGPLRVSAPLPGVRQGGPRVFLAHNASYALGLPRTGAGLVRGARARSAVAGARGLAVGGAGQRDHAAADAGQPGPARVPGVA